MPEQFGAEPQLSPIVSLFVGRIRSWGKHHCSGTHHRKWHELTVDRKVSSLGGANVEAIAYAWNGKSDGSPFHSEGQAAGR